MHTEPYGAHPRTKGGPPILAEASGDRQSRVNRRLDMAHIAHRPGRLIFGSDTWMGLAKLGTAGIPIIPILQMRKLQLRET